METIQGHKILKELNMVGLSYFNNFGVNVFDIGQDKIYMQAVKLGKNIQGHGTVIDKKYFIDRFRDEEKPDYDLWKDAFQFLDPNYVEDYED